jgi:hypothetical protein
MKTLSQLCVLLLLMVNYLNAQTQSEIFLKSIPPLPKDSCNITRSAIESFTQKVADLIDQTENEIDALHENVHEQ